MSVRISSRSAFLPLAALALLLVSSLADADGNFDWVAAIGGDQFTTPAALAIDSSNNVYLAGNFTGTIDLNPGAGTAEETAPVYDAYVIKLDSNGTFIWGFTLTIGISDMVIDNTGLLHIVGDFGGTQDFDPSGATANLTATATDAFLLKITSAGLFDSAFALTGPDGENARTVAVDSTGQIHIAGRFDGTTDFDPTGGTTELTATGDGDLFIAKYSAANALIWVKATSAGSTSEYVEPIGIAVDTSGGVAIAGEFRGSIDFDLGGGTHILTNADYPTLRLDIFLLKLDSNGDYEFAKRIGGDDDDHSAGVAIDSKDNIHFSGDFRLTVDLDPTAGIQEVTSAGSTDIFHTALDTNGNYLWHITIGDDGFELPYDMHIDDDDNILTIGTLKNSLDFDPGPGNTTIVPSNDGSLFPYSDVFIWKLGPTGAFKWVRAIGNQLPNIPTRIRTGSDGATYSTGYFQATLDFDPGDGTEDLAAIAAFDAFILKLDGPTAIVWSDFAYGGTETGSESQPYNTLAEALGAVTVGGTVRIKGDTGDTSTPEAVTINQEVTLLAVNGAVQLGQ